MLTVDIKSCLSMCLRQIIIVQEKIKKAVGPYDFHIDCSALRNVSMATLSTFFNCGKVVGLKVDINLC